MLQTPQSNLLLQKPYKKQKILKNFLEQNSGEWASRQKKDKTESVTGLGRRAREEIVKCNQTTAGICKKVNVITDVTFYCGQ